VACGRGCKNGRAACRVTKPCPVSKCFVTTGRRKKRGGTRWGIPASRPRRHRLFLHGPGARYSHPWRGSDTKPTMVGIDWRDVVLEPPRVLRNSIATRRVYGDRDARGCHRGSSPAAGRSCDVVRVGAFDFQEAEGALLDLAVNVVFAHPYFPFIANR
jgi:hypothetical protein